MCRCTSGTPAGNGRTTVGNTTSLTSRPGSLRKRASCRWNCYSTARCTASLPTKGGLSTQAVGKKTRYVDKFGNVWIKGQAGQMEKNLNGMYNLQKPEESCLSVLVLALMGNI